MVKINITLGAREITEHFAAGEHARNYQRAMIAEHLPAFLARFGGFMPVYDMAGNPDNPAALAATAARKARLEARRIAAELARSAAKAERMATAARLSETYTSVESEDDPSENDMLFSHASR
jgi:hypothetical protein